MVHLIKVIAAVLKDAGVCSVFHERGTVVDEVAREEHLTTDTHFVFLVPWGAVGITPLNSRGSRVEVYVADPDLISKCVDILCVDCDG